MAFCWSFYSCAHRQSSFSRTTCDPHHVVSLVFMPYRLRCMFHVAPNAPTNAIFRRIPLRDQTTKDNDPDKSCGLPKQPFGRTHKRWESTLRLGGFWRTTKYQYLCWRLRCRRTSQHGGAGPRPATACLIGAGMRGVDIKARDSIPLSLSRPLSIFRAPGIQGSRCHQRLPEHLLNSSLC